MATVKRGGGNNLQDISEGDLRKELERRKKEREAVPTPVSNPDFNGLQKLIVEGVNEFAADGREDEDFEHWVYEAAMEAVYGKGFWSWYNKRLQ